VLLLHLPPALGNTSLNKPITSLRRGPGSDCWLSYGFSSVHPGKCWNSSQPFRHLCVTAIQVTRDVETFQYRCQTQDVKLLQKHRCCTFLHSSLILTSSLFCFIYFSVGYTTNWQQSSSKGNPMPCFLVGCVFLWVIILFGIWGGGGRKQRANYRFTNTME
jgi:hypothetical protein